MPAAPASYRSAPARSPSPLPGPRRTPRHDPLAMDRRAPAPLPLGRCAAQPPVRRRRRHPHVRRRDDRHRSVPPPHPARPRRRRGQHAGTRPRRSATASGRTSAVRRTARADASGDQLGPLRDWMLENLALPLDLDTLARRAHMSRRTLTRRFREETGVVSDGMAHRRAHRPSTRAAGDDHRAGREHRPPHGTRRAGLCSSGLSPAHRHLTEGVPGRLPPRRTHLGVINTQAPSQQRRIG